MADSVPNKSLWKTFLAWGDNPFAGLGVGVMIGGAGAVVSLAILYAIGSILIAVAFIRAGFFGGTEGRLKRISFNFLSCVVLAGIVFGLWKITPRPKEFPTAEENAKAVLALMDQRDSEEALAIPTENPPATPLPQKKHKPPITKGPEQPSGPATSPPPTTPPPQVAELMVTQEQDVSSDKDNPFKTNVVVQTTKEFPSLNLALECDGPIDHGGGAVGGVMMMVREGVINGHPNVFVMTYQSAAPQFGPGNPCTLLSGPRAPSVVTRHQHFRRLLASCVPALVS